MCVRERVGSTRKKSFKFKKELNLGLWYSYLVRRNSFVVQQNSFVVQRTSFFEPIGTAFWCNTGSIHVNWISLVVPQQKRRHVLKK